MVSYCEFVTFPLVSWVRCGTWLYRFLIFAPLLTFITLKPLTGFPHTESLDRCDNYHIYVLTYILSLFWELNWNVSTKTYLSNVLNISFLRSLIRACGNLYPVLCVVQYVITNIYSCVLKCFKIMSSLGPVVNILNAYT